MSTQFLTVLIAVGSIVLGAVLEYLYLRRGKRRNGYKEKSKVIQLSESVGLGLIIEYPTGVVYSNQTGGTCCLQSQLEGAWVPLRNDVHTEDQRFVSPENDLCEYFEEEKYQGTGAVGGIDVEDADFLDNLLQRYNLTDLIWVDRSRLSESHEAWIYVLIQGEESGDQTSRIFTNFGPYPRSGVITWSNSD